MAILIQKSTFLAKNNQKFFLHIGQNIFNLFSWNYIFKLQKNYHTFEKVKKNCDIFFQNYIFFQKFATFWHKLETRQKPETRQYKTRTRLSKLAKTRLSQNPSPPDPDYSKPGPSITSYEGLHSSEIRDLRLMICSNHNCYKICHIFGIRKIVLFNL